MTTVDMTRVEAVKIARLGQSAARAGKAFTTCPFSATGSASDRLKAAAWLRGYAAGSR